MKEKEKKGMEGKEKGSTKKRKKREVGGRVCNREVEEGKGGKYVRTAGGSGVVKRRPVRVGRRGGGTGRRRYERKGKERYGRKREEKKGKETE